MFSCVLVFLLALQSCTNPYSFDIGRNNYKTSRNNKNSDRFLLATTVPLQLDQADQDFTVRIGLGNPVQYFDVQLDTTSSVTWVPSSQRFNADKFNNSNTNFSSNVFSNQTRTNNSYNAYNFGNSNYNNNNYTSYNYSWNGTIINAYDETRSNSSQNTNRSIEIEYEEGDVTGVWTYDKVNVASLVADGFAFVQATNYDSDYAAHRGGKLGLGLHSKHGEKFSLLSALQRAGAINKRMFALSQSENGGKLFLGDFPLSTYFNINKFSKCNVSSTEGLDDEFRDGWVCDISHVLLGDIKNLTNALEVDGRVIFDAAYQYIKAPKNFNKYFKNYFQSKNVSNCRDSVVEEERTIVCANNNNFSKLGSISFLLEGTAYRINAEELFEKSGEGYEFLVRFSDDNENIWRLGFPFVSQYTVVFDAEDFSVGFSGGNRVDYTGQWKDWYNGNSQADKANRFFYMIVGATIFGSILFIFIVFLIVHSIKRKRLEEHGPLINEHN